MEFALTDFEYADGVMALPLEQSKSSFTPVGGFAAVPSAKTRGQRSWRHLQRRKHSESRYEI